MQRLGFELNVRRTVFRFPLEVMDVSLLRKCPDRLWNPSSLLFSGYEEFIPLDKASGREAGHSVSILSRLRMREAVPPDSRMPSWWPLAHFYLHCGVQQQTLQLTHRAGFAIDDIPLNH